jgi:hypothetical protein
MDYASSRDSERRANNTQLKAPTMSVGKLLAMSVAPCRHGSGQYSLNVVLIDIPKLNALDLPV